MTVGYIFYPALSKSEGNGTTRKSVISLALVILYKNE